MGEVDLEIVGLAKKLGADLIVMGCRGPRGHKEGRRRERLRRGHPPRPRARSWWCLEREGTDPEASRPLA
jgi:hypothetical protein